MADEATNKESSAPGRQNVSFSFSKTTSKTLAGNKLDDAHTSRPAKDYVFFVDSKEIKSSAPKPKEKDLIIPLIKKNNWRISDIRNDQDPADEERKLKEMAIQELLKESQENAWQMDGSGLPNISIPLILQNKVPEGFETDENMDVSLRPDESKLEDYDNVPIEKFGIAMLRGMGWKDGDPIGNNAKQASKPIEVQLRPKGLGLGADASALNKSKDKKKGDDGEKLMLVTGAFVQILQGSDKGYYGQVLGLDEENARVIVKLKMKEKTSTYPEFSVKVVSKKEFEKESNVINQKAYDKYKKEQENRAMDDFGYRSKKESKERRDGSREKEKLSKEKKRSHKDKTSEQKDDYKKSKPSSYDSDESMQSSRVKSWVRPQLRVRFIDDEYKKGKYFNEKVIVMDVPSSKSCTCKTENGNYLEDISPSMLETVIPRSEHSYVMIVQGKYDGELCTILQKDKAKCLATVQFLSNRDKALQIEYDSICEYVGDVADFD